MVRLLQTVEVTVDPLWACKDEGQELGNGQSRLASLGLFLCWTQEIFHDCHKRTYDLVLILVLASANLSKSIALYRGWLSDGAIASPSL